MFSPPFFTVDVSVKMSFNYHLKYQNQKNLYEGWYENQTIDAKTAIKFLKEDEKVVCVNNLTITQHGFFTSKILYSHSDPKDKLDRLKAAKVIQEEATAAYGPIQSLFRERL